MEFVYFGTSVSIIFINAVVCCCFGALVRIACHAFASVVLVVLSFV